jgi:hypothetical protein
LLTVLKTVFAVYAVLLPLATSCFTTPGEEAGIAGFRPLLSLREPLAQACFDPVSASQQHEEAELRRILYSF